jgi:hypothetical protein
MRKNYFKKVILTLEKILFLIPRSNFLKIFSKGFCSVFWLFRLRRFPIRTDKKWLRYKRNNVFSRFLRPPYLLQSLYLRQNESQGLKKIFITTVLCKESIGVKKVYVSFLHKMDFLDALVKPLVKTSAIFEVRN